MHSSLYTRHQLTSESLEVLGQKQNLLLHSSAKGKGGGGASAQAQRGSEVMFLVSFWDQFQSHSDRVQNM